MSTRLDRDFSFQSALHFDEEFFINNYDISVQFHMETESMVEQSIAMARVEILFNSVLQNCLIVNRDDESAIEKYQYADLRICETPEDPYDQVVGMLLIQKMNAIMEGRMTVHSLSIQTKSSNGVRFHLDSMTSASLYPGCNWWNKPNLSINNDGINSTCHDKVVKLFESDQWVELGLAWHSNQIGCDLN